MIGHTYILQNDYHIVAVQSQSCLTLFDPMDCSMPGFLFFTISWKFVQTHVQLSQ